MMLSEQLARSSFVLIIQPAGHYTFIIEYTYFVRHLCLANWLYVTRVKKQIIPELFTVM